ncbi:hypothetical protein [Alkaliphilus peptidifermentans]|uniref:Uncharacterized protein n=1 Tax=Alkaliphilus peptidifermentans DSM 18978 TaxID=1120976 RepID=A0A1G5GF82_9FIRM|nr:hypothetical protein [Alkaliphilus peptidifermentans]SCY49959.1 hypothetical protein SAMN03080606_01661 [Alkaliphilus peptidifermentans DSM 18978]
MTRKILGFLAFVATGVGLFVSTVMKESNFLFILLTLAIAGLYAIGLMDHYKELQK